MLVKFNLSAIHTGVFLMTIRRVTTISFLLAGIIFLFITIRFGEEINDLLRYGIIYLALLLVFAANLIFRQASDMEGVQAEHNISAWRFFGRDIDPSAFLTITVVFLFSALSITLFLPPPLRFIQDQDWAHQLAGANEILKGQHPFVTFLDVYGPLTFYASAFAQFLFGTRVIGEIFLIVLGFSIAYTALYWLMWSISRDRLLAFLLLVILLILVPRLYKYYIVLGPALSLFFIWKYIESPSYKNLWPAGLAVTITGLFRPDFGVYMIVSTAIAMLSQQHFTIRKRLMDLLYFFIILLVCASPWLIFVTLRGGLQDYLYNSTIGMVTTGAGMSLPVSVSEDFFSLQNLQLMAKIAFNLIPGLSLFIWFLNRRAVDSSTSSMLFALIAASQLTLIQGLHRSDYGHLLQSIPVTFVLLAYLFKHGDRLSMVKNNILPLIGVGLGVGLLSVMLFFSLPEWRSISMSKTLTQLTVYNLPRDRFTGSLIKRSPNSNLLQAMNFVRTCTKPDDKIIAWPYLVDFYYFTDRPLGGRLKSIGPFFKGSDDQEVAVQDVQTDDVSFYIYRPMTFNSTARNIQDYAPIVADYLEETYIPIKNFGDIVIYIKRDMEPAFTCSIQ